MNPKRQQILGWSIAVASLGCVLGNLCMEGFQQEQLLTYITFGIACVSAICLIIDGRCKQRRAAEEKKRK